MKKSKAVFTMLLAALMSFCALGCGKPKVAGEGYLLTAQQDISGLTALVGGKKSIALVKRSLLNSKGRAAASSAADENVLAVEEMGGGLSELKFSGDEALSPSQMGLEPVKMTVSGDFTFVQFVSKKIREKGIKHKESLYVDSRFSYSDFTVFTDSTRTVDFEALKSGSSKVNRLYTRIYDRDDVVPYGYDRNGYINNKYVKSYVIHNISGRVYSLAAMELFDVQGALGTVHCVKSADKTLRPNTYYRLSVNDEAELTIKPLIGNTEARITEYYEGPDGWTYLFTDSVTGTDNDKKIMVFLDELSYEKYYVTDRNGYVYYVYTELKQIKKAVNGALVDVDVATAEIKGLAPLNHYWIEYTHLLEGKTIRPKLNFSDTDSVYMNYDYSKLVGSLSLNARYVWFDRNINYMITSPEDEKKLCYAQVDWEGFAKTNEAKMGNPVTISENVTYGPELIKENGMLRIYENAYTQHTLSKTEKFLLEPDGSGKPVKRILSETDADPNAALVIEPLN